MCLETLKELMIGVQDWDQIKQASWLACPALGEDLILLDQMDGDWQRWFLVTCPLWTG